MRQIDGSVAVLGIDTSNYTTSAACSSPVPGHRLGGFLLEQKKQLLRVKKGERGLRQSDAVFAHTVNLPRLIEELIASLPSDTSIAAVSCSTRPRRLEGSYMPCFLSGEASARAVAAAMHVPFYSFSHQEGHIAAAAYSAMEQEGETVLYETPFLAFHISGGTTDLLHVTPIEDGYRILPLGSTLDLNAGQTIDRTGIMLGLSFPAGPAMEALAAGYTGKPHKPKISVHGCDCNLSGLENLTAAMHRQGTSSEEIAAYTFSFLCATLREMTKNALLLHPGLPVLFAGGVMSNKLMRGALTDACGEMNSRAYFADPAFSSDNAAGISLLGCRALLRA